MISKEEQQFVFDYLKKVGVKHMEFFEELYDHIVTSFEDRVDKSQNISDHITNTIQPAFGGAVGIRIVQQKQEIQRSKMIKARFLSLFKEYFIGWPSVLISITLGLLIYLLNQFFDPKWILISFIVFGALCPLITSLYGIEKFRSYCRRNRLPYQLSDLNRRIASFSTIGVMSVNIVLNGTLLIASGSHNTGINFISELPYLQIPIGVVFILYTLVCVQLFKEKFIIKLAL